MKINLKQFTTWIYLLLILLSGFLLLADLKADAPGDIDHSAGLVFDPPSKCQTARNRILFGEWRTDEWTPYIHGALHTLIQYVFFYFWGIGMVTMRLPGSLMFWAAIILCALLASRGRSHLAAITALLFATVNPIALAYGRSGLLEPQLIFWIILSAWALDRAWHSGPQDRDACRKWLMLSGIAASAAFWTKGMAAYYIVAVVLLLLVCPPGRRRDTLYFFIPLALAIALYAGPFMTMNKEFFDREASHWIKRAQHDTTPWALWSRQPVFHQLGASRWILALGLLAIPLTWRRYREDADIPAGLRALGLTMVVGLQATAFMQYRPLRYSIMVFMISIPSAAWLIAETFRWANNPDSNTTVPHAKRRYLLLLLGFLILTYTLNFSVIYPLASAWRKHITFPTHWRLVSSGVISAVLILLWVFIKKPFSSWCARRCALVRIAAVALIWACMFTPILTRYAREIRLRARGREHQMHEFSKRLGKEYKDIMFAGTSPSFGGMENTHRPRKVSHFGVNHVVMHDPELTHLLIPDTWGQPAYFSRAFPETWARATRIDRIVISSFSHSLYALDRKEPVVERSSEGLIISNPDAHSPTYLTLLWHVEDGHQPEISPLAGIAYTLLPGATWKPDAPLSCRVIERAEWQRSGLPAEHLRTRSETDSSAWEQRSWRLGMDKVVRPDKPAYAEWKIKEENEIALLGVRMRGNAKKIEKLRFTWTTSGESIEWDAATDALQADRFTPFAYLLGGRARAAKGTLRIEVIGNAPLWIDAFLTLSESDLEASRP